jgi:hypothetical protein
MAPRLELQTLLESIAEHVYFQPPTNIHLQYPCIVYERDNAESVFANNENYRYVKRYMVTVIDRNPDSDLPDNVAVLPMCTFQRHFTADDLNHDVFNLFF